MCLPGADLVHNVEGVRFYGGDPDQFAFSACSHLGADNIVVTYDAGEGDAVFAHGFDACADCGMPSR